MTRRIPPSVGARDDIARRTKVFRRAATRPRRPVLEQWFAGDGRMRVVERPAARMSWKAARARVLEIHGPEKAPAKPRPCQGGKLRPAPGVWWQSRFADLVERRREGAPQLTQAQRRTLDVETHRVEPGLAPA